MQLNVTTDYAIRSLVYLAKSNKVMPASEIGSRVNISKNFVVNTMKELRNVGIVDSIRGVNGGFYLAKKPEEITLYDIIRTTEGEIKINRSDEASNFGKGKTIEEKAINDFYQEVQDEMLKLLKKKTIADLISE